MAKNAICHVEFNSTDLKRSQRFFEGMFGWTFRSFGDEMVVFGLGETHLGGITKVDKVEPGQSPTIWIEVDSLEDSLAKAQQVGGFIRSEPKPVPGVGRSAETSDPDGNHVGLVQFER